MAPPLRTDADVQAILAGLKDGTLEVIATDHAPHAPEKKMRELDQAPNGIIGLETLLPICVVALIEPRPSDLAAADREADHQPGARPRHRPGHAEARRRADVTMIDPSGGVDDRPEQVSLQEPQLPVCRLEGARPGRYGARGRRGQVRAGKWLAATRSGALLQRLLRVAAKQLRELIPVALAVSAAIVSLTPLGIFLHHSQEETRNVDVHR